MYFSANILLFSVFQSNLILKWVFKDQGWSLSLREALKSQNMWVALYLMQNLSLYLYYKIPVTSKRSRFTQWPKQIGVLEVVDVLRLASRLLFHCLLNLTLKWKTYLTRLKINSKNLLRLDWIANHPRYWMETGKDITNCWNYLIESFCETRLQILVY